MSMSRERVVKFYDGYFGGTGWRESMSEENTKISVTLGKGEDYSAICVRQSGEILWWAHNNDPEYETLIALHQNIEQLTKERDELVEALSDLYFMDEADMDRLDYSAIAALLAKHKGDKP